MAFALNDEQQAILLETILCNRFSDNSVIFRALVEPKLRHFIHVMSSIEITAAIARHPLRGYFSTSRFRSAKLSDVLNHIKLLFRCTIVEILAVRARQTNSPVDIDVNEFHAEYSAEYNNFFVTADDAERGLLASFCWYMKIAMTVFNPHEHDCKKVLLDIVCRSTGSTTRVVTGDTHCLFALRRVIIFEIESGVEPQVRPNQRKKRRVPITDEQRAAERFEKRTKKLAETKPKPLEQEPLIANLIVLNEAQILWLSQTVHDDTPFPPANWARVEDTDLEDVDLEQVLGVHVCGDVCGGVVVGVVVGVSVGVGLDEMHNDPVHYHADPHQETQAPILYLQELPLVQQRSQAHLHPPATATGAARAGVPVAAALPLLLPDTEEGLDERAHLGGDVPAAETIVTTLTPTPPQVQAHAYVPGSRHKRSRTNAEKAHRRTRTRTLAHHRDAGDADCAQFDANLHTQPVNIIDWVEVTPDPNALQSLSAEGSDLSTAFDGEDSDGGLTD